ncbi:Glycosyl hydrolase family protein isoform 3 [Hibiscus syriacus]|uniref:Glycosyl hydrolase family protein isoform 3 n=1 Tax=Hibiscus syriacus TaxID=106335 RepID=A0A6A2YVF2_HIBSY|nr:Glycosyl hydrolase family protein isoform 3 [Hibiscus syriacus]
MLKLQTPLLLYPIHTTSLLIILSESTQPPFACDSSDPATKSYPFCDPTLPTTERVRDLVSRLTLDEKISQLSSRHPKTRHPGIPMVVGSLARFSRQQRHSFQRNNSNGHQFPSIDTLDDKQKKNPFFQAVGIEGRAIYNGGQAMGLTFWVPNINIFRDPRRGRGQETPGEDPLVTGKYAVSYVSSQDLADTYQPPFQSCIEQGRASGVMCAYNQVNGIPNCAKYDLLSETAGGRWGFKGYITADCDAVATIFEQQGYVEVPEDAAADMSILVYLKFAGTDEDCVVIRLHCLLVTFGSDQICSQEHQNLALEAACNGIVLLKNTDKLLPLSKTGTTSLAVIGPIADSVQTLLGKYAGPPCKSVTPLQGLQGYVRDTRFHQGCTAVNCSTAFTAQAMNVASGADRVVLVMGLDQTQEGKFDRVDFILPPKQQELISTIARAAKNPVILVLLSGGAVDISFAKRIGSILWAGYPGEAGGRALTEIIFGDHNPGGRLPVTWYRQSYVNVPMTDMRMHPEPSSGYPGRTYRFYRGPKVGYGLSYSNYTYEILPIGTEVCDKMKFPVTVGAQNNSELAGKHPLLLFVRPAKMSNRRPVKQLVAFQSVNMNAGERGDIELELRPCEHLSSADEDGSMVIEEGSYFLRIGDKD